MTVADAKRYVDLAAKMLEFEVVKARAAGATWKTIADSLGITHQGARSRWAPVVTKALAQSNGNGAGSANGLLGAPDHARGLDTDPAPGPRNDGD
jgi:hypothetical protein